MLRFQKPHQRCFLKISTYCDIASVSKLEWFVVAKDTQSVIVTSSEAARPVMRSY